LWQALPKSTYDAALRLRQLAEQEWSSMLDKLPETRPAFTYQEDISRTEFAANAKWEEGYRETVRSFLARANGFEEWSARDLSEMTRRSRRPHLRTLATTCDTPGDPDDEFTRGWPEGSIVTIAPELPEEFVQEVIAAGCDPDEFADEKEIYVAPLVLNAGTRTQTISNSEPPPAHSSDAQRLAIQLAIAVRGQYRHIQMQHQLLPFEYNIPAAHEVRLLQARLDVAWRDLGNSLGWDLNDRRKAEMITLVKIQLWFGVSLKRAQGLVVMFTTVEQPAPNKGVAEGNLIYDLTTGEWSVPIDMPPYRSVILDPAGQAHPQLKWVPVQDVADVGRHIKALLENAREMNRRIGKAASEPSVLFPLDEKSYEQAAREFLRADDSTRRITLRRLGGFVLNRMVSLTGDLMVGTLVTGRLGTLTRTERFYASYSADELRGFYYQAASKMLEEVMERATDERSLLRPEIWNGHAGARLCALDKEVRDAIRKLQEGIVEAKDIKPDGIRYHNLLTLYSVLLFCFCTSCRPVRAPYLGLNRIDEETGFAYLADKDDDAHHKLRLIWVPQLCRDQMLKYAQHCARMALHSEEIRDWPDPCFFLIKKGSPVRVRLGTLPDDLERFLELQPNFYRAYLRHRLLKAGTPAEVVMAWLGHAFAGEEIWNIHSAMSPTEYRDCISSFLMPILENDLKWKVM
jgi:integrase